MDRSPSASPRRAPARWCAYERAGVWGGRRSFPESAAGAPLLLDEPLSFWGGLDPALGAIIDRRHPQRGANVADRMLMMPAGRGSSGGSAILAEALRLGKGPAAHPDAGARRDRRRRRDGRGRALRLRLPGRAGERGATGPALATAARLAVEAGTRAASRSAPSFDLMPPERGAPGESLADDAPDAGLAATGPAAATARCGNMMRTLRRRSGRRRTAARRSVGSRASGPLRRGGRSWAG